MATRRSPYRLDPHATRDLAGVRADQLGELSDDELLRLAEDLQGALAQERKENQLLYFKSNSPAHLAVHTSTAHKQLIGGGNRAGKTSEKLAMVIARATGITPLSLADVGIPWDTLHRGRLRCRFVCANLDTTLDKFLKQLKWDEWTGPNPEGGARGHWGWIPREHLIDGDWGRSWDAKSCTLSFRYRCPRTGQWQGESTLQFMSHHQKPQSMASVDIDELILDEVPPYSVYRESCARVMGVGGYLYLAMTWPDDPSIPVDWLFDELYDRALPGPHKDPDIDYFEIATADNPNVDQEGVAKQEAAYAAVSGAVADTRMRGKPIRFSNRVHPLFVDNDEGDWYCHECGTLTHVDPSPTGMRCAKSRRDSATNEPFICDSPRVHILQHVRNFEFNPSWPVVWVVDPHPRKPHMSLYIAVRPDNTAMVVEELEVVGDATDIRVRCDEVESAYGFHVRARIGDPRMLAAPNGMDRNRMWIDEFHAAGLYVEQANSDTDTGVRTVNQLLTPDEFTHDPKLLFHPRVRGCRLQMSRFMWDDYKNGVDKDQKQQTKKKYDDYPGMIRYFGNGQYTFESLLHGAAPVLAINMRRPDRERYMARRQAFTAPRGHYVQ